MSRLSDLGTRAALVIGSLLFALAVGEVALRASWTEERTSGGYWGHGAFVSFPAAGYRHAPGFRGRALRSGVFVCPVEIDDLGLRQPDREAQSRFARRLLVLGDSFPFGLGVRERESFPALLGKELNAANIGVINGGQTGYCLTQSVAWGRWLIPQIQPRAVLITVFLENDVQGEFFSQWRQVDVVDGYRLQSARWPRGGLADFLRTRSRVGLLVGGIANRMRQRRMEPVFDRAVREDQAALVDAAAAPIVDLDGRCRGDGITLGVVMIPPRNGPTPFDDGFRSRLEAAGIPILDLTRERRPEHYFVGDGHWNAAGHAAAAASLAGFAARLADGAR
jgi:lysophospholipase L1-like esterase